jgi:hypothetical protein
MRMVQMPIHEIVDMTVMRHGLVSAAGTMDMARLMTGTAVIRRAGIRVRLRHLDHMLVHMVAMRMVQMAIMQIVDMVAVPHRGMPATGAMRVAMVGVVGLRTATHYQISSSWNHTGDWVQPLSVACSTALRIRLTRRLVTRRTVRSDFKRAEGKTWASISHSTDAWNV